MFALHRRDEAAERPKREFVPKTLSDLHVEGYTGDDLNGASTFHVPFPSSTVETHNNSSLYSQSSYNSWPKGELKTRKTGDRRIGVVANDGVGTVLVAREYIFWKRSRK